MKKALLLSLCIIFSASLFAQSEKDKKAYADRAAQLQTEIWGNPAAEFKSTAVPANFDKESAVILARTFSLSRASSGKIKFGHAIGITTRTTKLSIFHERVKINDKTALEGFSTLEYQKKLDKSTSEGFAKYVNTNNTYIGAKVLKPTGKEVLVNTSEEVLINNESKDQKGKLAIPDLQVGDILDYYVCKEDVADKEAGNSYKDNDNLFFLVDEYPVLYYSLDFQYNKKIKVKTIYANGAQHFDTNTNEDGDQLFSLKLHNVPKYESTLWTSELRQYPYIEIGSAYNDNIDEIIKKYNIKAPEMFEAHKRILLNELENVKFTGLEDLFRDYFHDKKSLKKASLDSSMKALYAVWKFNTFCQYGPEDIENFTDLKYRVASGLPNTLRFAIVLSNFKIDYDILLISSRYSNSLENVFNGDDFTSMIRINGTVPGYICFDDIVSHYNEIPERFQGEKALILHPKKIGSRDYIDDGEAILPVSPSNQNVINEYLNVSVSAPDMQKVKMERSVKETGALRHPDQKELLGVDDIDDCLKTASNGSSIDARYKGWVGQGSKRFIEALKTDLVKESTDKQKRFKVEIKEKYDQEPQDVADCKIINSAVDQSKPVFEFTETFTLNNLVKKAGNNYIVDAGKLTGGFMKLDEKDKKRDKDVYIPSARIFKYTIVINIPQGYTAKGMEELTQNKTNKTGSFVSSATLNGNKLTITLARTYNNNFEKASDWPMLSDIITAASDFESKKILLEKQN